MNLFNEFVKKNKVGSSINYKEIVRIKPYFIVIAIIICLGAILTLKTKAKYLKQEGSLLSELKTLKTELESLESLHSQKTTSKENPIFKKIKRNISGIDASWVSILWKFSALSSDKIIITEMELNRQSEERIIKIRGKATSLSSLEIWLKDLIDHVSGAQFVIENQQFIANSSFPYEFVILTKVL